LYMLGLIVHDMSASLEFYRRLGVDIPQGSESKTHVEIEMNGLTFFLDSRPQRWDPGFAAPPAMPPLGSYGAVLEFYLETKDAVDALHAELVGFGYASHAAPRDVGSGENAMRFAFVNDPDGNTVLLSGMLHPQPSSSGGSA
jgi:catechol 2,3-dioxygenase-like lactoylglutathione lyase family enzyme